MLFSGKWNQKTLKIPLIKYWVPKGDVLEIIEGIWNEDRWKFKIISRIYVVNEWNRNLRERQQHPLIKIPRTLG